MKKVCSTCKEEKNTSDFRKDKTKPDGYQPRCKVCARSSIKSAYMEKYADKVRHRDKANRERNAALLLEYKKQHPCRVCGETEPICLDFHHLDPSEKEFSVGQEGQRSWKQLDNEISKCVILCANCHRKVHAGVIEI